MNPRPSGHESPPIVTRPGHIQSFLSGFYLDLVVGEGDVFKVPLVGQEFVRQGEQFVVAGVQLKQLHKSGERPGLELPQVVVRDVKVIQMLDALEDILLHLRDAVVANVKSPEWSQRRQELVVQLGQLVEGQVKDLELGQVEDRSVDRVGDQFIFAEVQLRQGRHICEGLGRHATDLKTKSGTKVQRKVQILVWIDGSRNLHQMCVFMLIYS